MFETMIRLGDKRLTNLKGYMFFPGGLLDSFGEHKACVPSVYLGVTLIVGWVERIEARDSTPPGPSV